MSESPSHLRTTNPDAHREYQTGLVQKTQGKIDSALTSFRRAVIADPNFVEAQHQIGLICKEKARIDPMFQRYAFEAFRIVARLDPGNQAAHDQYIQAAQVSKRMEELHAEYDALAKQNPQNELFQRCYKNIITLELAMIPQTVNVGDARASGTMRKFTLLISLGMILLGVALMFLPVVMNKGIEKKHWGGMMKTGLAMILAGFGGIFAFTQMK
jgi:hypothetical protein